MVRHSRLVCRRSRGGAAWVAFAGLAIVAALAAPACSETEEPPAIRFDEVRMTVQNRTGRTWTDVEIWVNDHYRMQVPSLAAGQVAAADLRNFVAGFGQRFNPAKQLVYGVEVSSREGSRREVKLSWGKGRRH